MGKYFNYWLLSTFAMFTLVLGIKFENFLFSTAEGKVKSIT